MSFLDKIRGKGKGRDDEGSPELPLDDVIAVDVPVHDETVPAAADSRASVSSAHLDSSIITEAAPSEIAEFSETRMPPPEEVSRGQGTGLPLIGEQSVGMQQRVLVGMVLVGLAGLLITAGASIFSATKGAAQVGASGQALMQSQRLAKSVSQALIGSTPAFLEVKESRQIACLQEIVND